MTVIDVHTHMIGEEWLDLLDKHGGEYTLGPAWGRERVIHKDGAPFMTPTRPMLDYDLRIENMNEAGVDIAIISLTCPNVYWGTADISARAATSINMTQEEAQRTYPARIRWFATLPWQHEEHAVAELDRAVASGAAGVVVLGNIAGEALTSDRFAGVWSEIDRKALPVLVHPTTPPGTREMGLSEYHLAGTIGFTLDTSLALARMAYDGFFERYPNLRIIASHGGGQIPYIAGRLDHWYRRQDVLREAIDEVPSHYLKNIYYDAVVYEPEALDFLVGFAGPDRVLYGSDYPHKAGDMPGCLDRVEALGGDVAHAVKGANAEKLFGIG